ncbi:MAG: DUF4199 domain-containing protein, partial [Cyclobacteriaceae bacterium]|nr:DUF4199 domain-containing protein [Cyclobacteriaceae bacterium]
GLRAALVMVGLAAVNFTLVSGGKDNYQISEVIGYLTMFLAMVFVFLGIRYYRDHQNQGKVSFTQSLKIGLLIALFPALTFGILDHIYISLINPNFQEEYYQMQVEKIDADAPDYQAQVDKLQAEREAFANPLVLFLVMTVTVLLIGLVVTIISGLILKRDTSVSTP